MKEITEGNKIIAQFMGAKYFEHPMKHLGNENEFIFEKPPCEYHSNKYWAEDRLHYHHLWDWLMPVVEKIESDASQETGHCEIQITENNCRIYRMSYVREFIKTFNPKSKIMAVWEAIVQYIQWYNKTKN